MSYINEALKKAQREKDALYLKYTGIISARGKGKKIPKGRSLWMALVFLSAIFLAFGAYSWLNTPDKQTSASVSKLSKQEAQPSPSSISRVKAQDNRTPAPTSRGNARTQSAPKTVESKRPAEPSQPQRTVNAQTLYERAERFRKQGRLKDARRFYEETLKVDPVHADALFNLGAVCFDDKDYSAAQRSFEAVTRINPGDVDAYYNLFCVHAVKGELRQGLAYLRKAVSLSPLAGDWAREDPDLDGLRGVPEFEEILKAIE